MDNDLLKDTSSKVVIDLNKSKLVVAFLIVILTCSFCGLVTCTNKNVGIESPKDKDIVSARNAVWGNCTNCSELHPYIIIWPIESEGPWYIQKTTLFPDNSFYSNAFFGGDPKYYPEDIGTTYKIVAIIINQTLRDGRLDKFPEVPESDESDPVIVIRG